MARRLWTPADMVGVANHEYTDTTKGITTADGTFVAGSIVNRQDYQLVGSGTPDYISAFRDDFRPALDAINGQQAIKWDTATRQMDISKTNLPQGDGDKFWWTVDVIDETRTDDRYIWGYGGSNGSSVAYKMRQGGVPYSDIGSVGYAIGTAPVKAGELSIITEQYTKADTTSKASYNGGAWSTYKRARNTAISNAARYGHWAVYGNGSAHRSRFRGHGYGTPTEDDWQRLRGWASWAAGANGANLVDGHPYKDAPPYVDEGGAGVTASGGAVLGAIGAAAGAALMIASSAALALAPLSVAGGGGAAITSAGAQVLAPGAATGAGAATAAVASSGAPTLAPIVGGGTGSAAQIVSAQGNATLAGLSATGFGFAPVAGSAIVALARVAGAGVGAVGTGAASTSLLRPLTAAGLSSAPIVGRGGRELLAPSPVARASSPIGGTGAASLAPIVGAGTGSPPAPPIVVPPSRRFTLASAGSRRATLASSGSRRLTI
ncbi:hypothetical protein [Sphingomonas sp. RIT328]|uniref:hypothetical protein n=1 Tax=Sphingomonas sp. RIT328 TaxID=1470591 RepID=UPI00044887E8|nr:hypothetical protein [Sphingomonas sp. RIT328]EZP57272.1 hypothetical protein BW41_00115 [Sphingomonas sp. RIT328]